MKTVSLSIIVYLLHNALFMSIVCRYISNAINRTPFHPFMDGFVPYDFMYETGEAYLFCRLFVFKMILCER
jgi:hypothetical protein